MSYITIPRKNRGKIRNSTLVLISFSTVFFPRLLSNLGAPSFINFAHFLIVPLATGIILLQTPRVSQKQTKILGELSLGLVILAASMTASALLNRAGLVNLILSFMFFSEPFVFSIALVLLPIKKQYIDRVRSWFLSFALINLGLAIAQSILMPIGLYPRPVGGTLQDNIVGVFGGGGGSAGNYISSTISIYVSIYFLSQFKSIPTWMKIGVILAALYHVQVSDSKQVFVALFFGLCILAFTKFSQFQKLIFYLILAVAILWAGNWAIQNLDYDFLSPYRNWINRPIYGWNGEASQTKFAAFRIVPTHFTSLLNWFFGLGPGHGVCRLGGWILRDYSDLLFPLGATDHPASAEVFRSINDGHLAKESTIFFPLFTWAGLWSEFGPVGLVAYVYLCSIVWRRLCMDDFCKFLLLSTVVFGFILTQMEEPAHMLTIAVLIGLRWHETQIQKKILNPK